jgi:hypothetical protein
MVQHMRVYEVLRYAGATMIHLEAGTFQWVSIKRFESNGDLPDAELLAALIGHPQYHDHYAGGDIEHQGRHNLHGPYDLAHITTASFVPTTAADGRQLVQSWADSLCPQPVDVQKELGDQVYATLDAASVYQLPDLRPGAQHEWGWVVGSTGFHEFVAISQDRTRLVLIVASDD